jgi:hypothetical protein
MFVLTQQNIPHCISSLIENSFPAFREETTVRREIDEGFPQQLQANSEDLES